MKVTCVVFIITLITLSFVSDVRTGPIGLIIKDIINIFKPKPKPIPQPIPQPAAYLPTQEELQTLQYCYFERPWEGMTNLEQQLPKEYWECNLVAANVIKQSNDYQRAVALRKVWACTLPTMAYQDMTKVAQCLRPSYYGQKEQQGTLLDKLLECQNYLAMVQSTKTPRYTRLAKCMEQMKDSRHLPLHCFQLSEFYPANLALVNGQDECK